MTEPTSTPAFPLAADHSADNAVSACGISAPRVSTAQPSDAKYAVPLPHAARGRLPGARDLLPCRFTQLRRTSSMHVCQPGPMARKCPITCGESQMWMCTLTSAFLGRPRGRVRVPRAGRTTLPPTETSARSNCSCVHPGASSGSTQERLVACFFPRIAFPHRDDVAIGATRSPDHHHQSSMEHSLMI